MHTLHSLTGYAIVALARTLGVRDAEATSLEPAARHFPPDPAVIARTAKTAAVLEWMVVVGLLAVGMVVVCVLALRLAKPRGTKVVRERTAVGSAWIEAGRRMELERTGPREDPGLNE